MAALLILSVTAVVVVNGWTDAPGALTTVVCAGALPYRRAVGLVALCNGVGAALAGLLLPRVASTMLQLAVFPRLGGWAACLLLCLVLWVVSLWGALAWVWGIPTSESHALLAALGGAALAVGGGSPDLALWGQVGLGLICSAGGAWLLGRWMLPRNPQPQSAALGTKQTLYCAGLALLHGAQDGQKYTAMLCAAGLGSGFGGQLGAVLLCACAMALGSSLGGGRIVQSIGSDMAPLDGHTALCTDRASALTLAVCTLLGLPVSTSTVKVCSSAGAAHRLGLLHHRVFGRMWAAWLLTFPVCLGLGWLGGKICLFLSACFPVLH